MLRALRLLAILLGLGLGAGGQAHEVRPGYLELQQTGPETYDVLWKVPAIDESTTLKVKPQFPDGTELLTPVRSTFSRGVAVQRWRGGRPRLRRRRER